MVLGNIGAFDLVSLEVKKKQVKIVPICEMNETNRQLVFVVLGIEY